jgi:hypothetical protein
MKNSTHTLDLAFEIIGFDEVPPRDYNPQVAVYTPAIDSPAEIWEFELIGFDEIPPADYVAREDRERLDVDAAFDTLEAAYDGGVESQAVFLAHLVAVNIPECEGLRLLTMWRQTHEDPWVREYDAIAEMHCR